MSRWPPPPRLSAAFYKGHGLGNDYLVFEEGDDWLASPENVRAVCHRHRGAGGDGIVALLAGPSGPSPGREAGEGSAGTTRAHLRMFNPDGGEFERSGNGLRVLASYLMRSDPTVRQIDAEVGGASVRMVGHGREGCVYDVSVDMGRAATGPEAVDMRADALDPDGRLAGPDGTPLRVVPVSVGNPHAVILCDDDAELTEERLARVGPFVSEHPAFEHGTNVQLALSDGAGRCRALIWERGVGRTSASGTSACAVAVAMVSVGRVAPGEVSVRMPGGVLRVGVTSALDVVLRGPVEEVMEGRLSGSVLS